MDTNTKIFLLVTLVPLSLWVLKEFVKDFPILFGKDEESE